MILDEIVRNKRLEVYEDKKSISMDKICEMVMEKKSREIYGSRGNLKFRQAISSKGFNIIGEVKKTSPSKGLIVEDFDVIKIAKKYNEMPVKAISVLTEKKFFMGSPEYIKQVKSVTAKAILRKDFIVDKYQIYETALLGCQGILLIAAVLGDDLGEFYNLALELNIEPLVEVHNKEEIISAMALNPHIIGINNRNLNTFNVNLETTAELIKYVNEDTIVISESGIKNESDIAYLKSLNANGALIGEAFMIAMEDKNKLQEFF